MTIEEKVSCPECGHVCDEEYMVYNHRVGEEICVICDDEIREDNEDRCYDY